MTQKTNRQVSSSEGLSFSGRRSVAPSAALSFSHSYLTIAPSGCKKGEAPPNHAASPKEVKKGICADASWSVYRAQTKGKVESGVKYIRRNFLCGLQGREPSCLSDRGESLVPRRFRQSEVQNLDSGFGDHDVLYRRLSHYFDHWRNTHQFHYIWRNCTKRRRRAGIALDKSFTRTCSLPR
jgi:hypothetical protein